MILDMSLKVFTYLPIYIYHQYLTYGRVLNYHIRGCDLVNANASKKHVRHEDEYEYKKYLNL